MSMEEIKDRLREDGYVIIPNVLNDEECHVFGKVYGNFSGELISDSLWH